MIALVRRTAVTWAVFVAILAAGCAGSPSTGDRASEPAAADSATTAVAAGAPTIEQAREVGSIARAIDADPNRTAEILAEHGMTAETLENLIYEIAKDPQLSEAYEAARGGASG